MSNNCTVERTTCDSQRVVATATKSADGTWVAMFYVDELLVTSQIIKSDEQRVLELLNRLSAEIAATLEGPTLWTQSKTS